MLRLRAVIHLLAEDVAGMRLGGPYEGEGDGAIAARVVADLRQGERRALMVAVIAGLALGLLLAARQGGAPFLSFAGEDALFSAAALLVAAFGGLRLGQWQRLRAVRRALEELAARSDP
ncbi:MAG TPA: hypothetical protein VMT16_11265 [Thermoanaerobaculia bacterium]|nr:hypothetical protein [Thermoanaerobaculia bacterium]